MSNPKLGEVHRILWDWTEASNELIDVLIIKEGDHSAFDRDILQCLRLDQLSTCSTHSLIHVVVFGIDNSQHRSEKIADSYQEYLNISSKAVVTSKTEVFPSPQSLVSHQIESEKIVDVLCQDIADQIQKTGKLEFTISPPKGLDFKAFKRRLIEIAYRVGWKRLTVEERQESALGGYDLYIHFHE